MHGHMNVKLLRSLSFRLKERNRGDPFSNCRCSLSIDQSCITFTKFETVHDIDTTLPTLTSLQGTVGDELQIPLNNLPHLNNWTRRKAWRRHSPCRLDGIPTVVVSFPYRMKTPLRKFWFSDSTFQITSSPERSSTHSTPWNVGYITPSCHAHMLFLSHEVKQGKGKFAPIFSKEHFFLEDSQSLAFLTSSKCSMWMKMGVEHWWNDTGTGKTRSTRRITNLSQFQFVHHKSHIFSQRTHDSAIRSRRLFAWTMTQPWRLKLIDIIHKDLSRTS